MSIFDKLSNLFNRAAPKNKAQERYFKGATFSRLVSNWIASFTSINKSIRQDNITLRARARDLSHNDPYIKMYLALLTNNVVGSNGIKFQSKITRNFNLATKENYALEASFNKWARSASVCGKFSLTQMAQHVIRTLAVDGEVLVRLVNVPTSNNDFGFAMQLIDCDQLDSEYNIPPGLNQNEVRMGVELDSWGKPIAYHIWSAHQADYELKRDRLRIPAKEILHIYDLEQANQTRGITWLNSIMMPLKMLEGYQEAELVAARTASAKMGFLTYSDTAISNLEGEIPTQPLQFDAAPGSIEMLPPGLEFKEWNPDHPTTAYADYTKSVLRQVASGLRVSYNSLANDLSDVNYSSMRSGILIERENFKTLQQLMIHAFYKPVFKSWFMNAAALGLIKYTRAQFDFVFDQITFSPRGFDWVDPLRDVQASVLAIENGLRSRDQIISESGDDFYEIIDSLSAEKKYADAAGLILGASPNNILAAQQNAPAQPV